MCINCNDSTPNDYKKGAVEGFQARIPPFCDMLSTALDVAANAFPGCPSPQLTLNQTCHSSRSGIPGTWAMYWVFNGSCGGSNMQVAVNGGWETSFPSPPSTAVPEAAGAPAPDYATSSDYAPAPAPTTAPGPSSGSADYTDYADSMIKTPTPVSQWTWASEALPSAGPAAAPTGPAPVPAVAPAPVPEVANVTAVPPPMAPAPASAGSVAGHIGAALMAMVGVVAAF